jgi:hypothetical protein
VQAGTIGIFAEAGQQATPVVFAEEFFVRHG